MHRALERAATTAERGEVPVGAVLVFGDTIIAEAGNAPVRRCDPSAHAEMRVLRVAGRRQRNYRLADTTLYVTLEPCAMCVGAILHARVARLVFGAYDLAAGAVVSRHVLLDAPGVHRPPAWRGGVLADASSKLLRDFFQARRS